MVIRSGHIESQEGPEPMMGLRSPTLLACLLACWVMAQKRLKSMELRSRASTFRSSMSLISSFRRRGTTVEKTYCFQACFVSF